MLDSLAALLLQHLPRPVRVHSTGPEVELHERRLLDLLVRASELLAVPFEDFELAPALTRA